MNRRNLLSFFTLGVASLAAATKVVAEPVDVTGGLGSLTPAEVLRVQVYRASQAAPLLDVNMYDEMVASANTDPLGANTDPLGANMVTRANARREIEEAFARQNPYGEASSFEVEFDHSSGVVARVYFNLGSPHWYVADSTVVGDVIYVEVQGPGIDNSTCIADLMKIRNTVSAVGWGAKVQRISTVSAITSNVGVLISEYPHATPILERDYQPWSLHVHTTRVDSPPRKIYTIHANDRDVEVVETMIKAIFQNTPLTGA